MTCQITGTPTKVIASPLNFTIRGSNAGNPAATTWILISVLANKPTSLYYQPPTKTYILGEQGSFPVPMSTGGTITVYTISPALDGTIFPGLEIQASSGVITGTPNPNPNPNPNPRPARGSSRARLRKHTRSKYSQSQAPTAEAPNPLRFGLQ